MNKLRDRVIDSLTAAYAADEISADEYERRVELAARSSDRAEIEGLLAGLQRGDHSPAGRLNDGAVSRRGEITAVFASVERIGKWSVPRFLEATAVFGSSYVDLRECALPPGGMRIEATAVFGSLQIVVPPGVNVRVKSSAVFGSASGGSDQVEDEAAPTVEIEATAVFGSCDIKKAAVGELVTRQG